MDTSTAAQLVLDLARGGTRLDMTEDQCTIACEIMEAFFQEHGLEVNGDPRGAAEPATGDQIVFLPLAEKPPAGRAIVAAPTAGKIVHVLTPADCQTPGFPYEVEIDDRARTRLYASREEIHIVKQAAGPG